MNGWEVINRAVTIISRFPVEQLITNRSDKGLDRLEQRLKEKGLLNPAAKTAVFMPPPEISAPDNPPEKARGGVSREDTVLYHNREIGKLLLRMERHYAQKMRINGIPCDCGAPKHLLDLEAMAEETIPMVLDSGIYYRILNWVKEVGPKSTEEAAKSGNYDDQYPLMSYEARDLRKDIIGSLAPGALFPVKPGKTTETIILPILSEEEKQKVKEAAQRKLKEVLA